MLQKAELTRFQYPADKNKKISNFLMPFAEKTLLSGRERRNIGEQEQQEKTQLTTV